MTMLPVRAATGAVLALITAALLLTILSGPPERAVATGSWVYRLDARDAGGAWAVYRWGVATGAHRTREMRTQQRNCRRDATGHACRATVEASFPDPDRAAADRRRRCLNYRVDHGRLPTGTTSC
ncbi:hypothetical protein [Cryptosporangium japonicum]